MEGVLRRVDEARAAEAARAAALREEIRAVGADAAARMEDLRTEQARAAGPSPVPPCSTQNAVRKVKSPDSTTLKTH